MAEIFSWALTDNGCDELYIKQSPIHNKGLFTCKNLPPQTILFRLTNNYPVSKLKLLAALAVPGSTDKADSTLKYVNHSCNPNAVLTDDGHLINTQYILSGSEITIDYTATFIGKHWDFRCTCNDSKCREPFHNACIDPLQTPLLKTA